MTDFLYIHIGGHCELHFAQTHRDYEGNARRTPWSINAGKGMEAVPHSGNMTLYPGDLILPCTREATNRIVDFLHMQRLMGRRVKKYGDNQFDEVYYAGEDRTGRDNKFFGPYYFTVDMSAKHEFEGTEPHPHYMGGPDTAYARIHKRKSEGFSLRRLFATEDTTDNSAPPEITNAALNPEGLNYARHNCWTSTQGLVQYIAGIDLAQVSPDLVTCYRAAKATDVKEKLKKTLGKKHTGIYDVINRHDDFLIAQRRNNPPFIMVTDYNTQTESILNQPLYGDDSETVGDWCAKQTPFAPAPVSQHAHMNPPPSLWQRWMGPS